MELDPTGVRNYVGKTYIVYVVAEPLSYYSTVGFTFYLNHPGYVHEIFRIIASQTGSFKFFVF